MTEPSPTVAEYTVQRLARLGLSHAFGVPGDYTFPIDNAIEDCPGLQWVLCANELNAAYAADGYARMRGAALLTTTYGVGELSALNGVMGARAHRLPIFHVVGAPSLRIQKARLITHHSLGDGLFGQFAALSAAAACVSAQLTADNAIQEVERVIREALRLSAPAYVLIPEDQALMPVIGEPVQGVPLTEVRRHASVPRELEAAVGAVLERLGAARRPIALPTMLVARYGLTALCEAFLTQSRIPFATTPMDKGLLSESHPGYLGIYNGAQSCPPELARHMAEADLVLDIGGVIREDINTGFWTDSLDAERLITLGAHDATVGRTVFTGVTLDDMLAALVDAGPKRPAGAAGSGSPAAPGLLPLAGAGDERLSSAAFYPRLQRLLQAGDVLVAETGSCLLQLPRLRLPAGVGYQAQTLWGSIGWATPATLGIALADGGKRVILVTGDGAHQCTANDLGAMGRYGIQPIIFVLNNGLYGVEELVGEKGHVYDHLVTWDYPALPAAMGCKDWFTARLTTVGELDAAIDALRSVRTAAYLELMIPSAESQPLPEAILQQLYKTATP